MWGWAVAILGALFVSKKGSNVMSDMFGPPIEAFTTGNKDIDILARTCWGEARGEGMTGMQAVANVVMNRYAQAKKSTTLARRFGATVRDICQQPYQFSCWNKNDPNRALLVKVTLADPAFRMAMDIATLAVLGRLPDITNGSDHYHTNAIKPSWSSGKVAAASIGSHKFYNDIA